MSNFNTRNVFFIEHSLFSLGLCPYEVITLTYSTSSRRHSFVMGRITSWPLVKTLTVHTRPSWPGLISVTLPNGHSFLGARGSTTMIMSPAVRSLCADSHCVRCRRDGRYSRVHRRQNTSARYCTCFHFFLEYWSFPLNVPVGAAVGRSSNKWLGLNGSKSL